MNRFLNYVRALMISVLAVILGGYVWPMRTVPAAYVASSGYLDMMPYSGYIDRVYEMLPADESMMLTKAEHAKLPVGYFTQLTPSEATQEWTKFRSAYGDRPLYALLSSQLMIPRRYEPGVSTLSGQPVLATSSDLNEKQRDFIAFLKRGEQLDPDNAYYNLRLADYYWSFSIFYNEGLVFTPGPMKPSTPKMGRDADQDTSLPKKPEIVNRRYFEAGLAEYDKALKKRLRLYQRELYQAAFRNLPKAVFVEQYMDRMNMSIRVATNMADARRITTVARLLAKQGDVARSLSYLQPRPYIRMMTGHPGFTNGYELYIVNRIAIMTAVRRDIMLTAGQKVHAQRLSEEYRQLDKLRTQSDRYVQVYLSPMASAQLVSILLAQSGWQMICLFSALLVAAGLLRQLVWFGVSRITRHAVKDTGAFRVPRLLGTVTAVVIILLTVITIMTALRPEVSANLTVLGVSVLLVVLCGIYMRFQFKRHCLAAGIAIPRRWTEIACNWLPVLFIFVYYQLEKVLTHGVVLEFDAVTLRLLFALPFLALLGAVMQVKLRTPEYYAMANLAWQRYLAVLVVWLSVAGWPLLLASEVLVLQHDNTRLGAYKSAEVLNNRDQLQLQVYLGKAEKILRQYER